MAKKGLLGVASAIALLTLLSKGFGFGRELVIAFAFGAGPAKDAYTAAYIIPAFALIMLGGLTGPFHTVSQKIITTLRQRGQDDDVPGVMATVLLAVSLVMGALSLVAYGAAPALIKAVASQASPLVFAMAVDQLRIMSPLLLLGGLVGVLCGISNDRGDFTLPSLSPLIASGAVIAVVLLFRGDATALAWGTMLGGIGQFLLQAPAGWKLLRSGPKLRLDFGHTEVRGLWPLLLPASISSTIGTINVIIGTNFASSLPAGSISVFDYANKLIQLPLGILMTALLIPLFPLLTQAVVAEDRPNLFHWLNRGLSTIALGTMPLVALFVAAGQPLVAGMYERGAFRPEATLMTYQVLAIIALSIVAYAARDLFIRVFYALHDSRTPLLVSLLSIATTTAFMAVLVGPFRLQGLAAATAAVTLFNCFLIAFLLRRKLGELPLGPSLKVLAQSGLAALAAGLAAWGVAQLPFGWLHQGRFLGHVLLAGAQCSALGVVYGVALLLMGFSLRGPLDQIRGRFRRPTPAAENPTTVASTPTVGIE